MSTREFSKQLNSTPKGQRYVVLGRNCGERSNLVISRSRRDIIALAPIPDLNIHRLID